MNKRTNISLTYLSTIIQIFTFVIISLLNLFILKYPEATGRTGGW